MHAATLPDTASGLLAGAAGGTVFWLLGLPAPWLAGSMMAAVAAVFWNMRIAMPDWLKTLSFLLPGMQPGSAVTWDTVARAAQWPLSIALLGLTVIAVTWACAACYVKRGGWDAPTALFASLPFALSLLMPAVTGFVLARLGEPHANVTSRPAPPELEER